MDFNRQISVGQLMTKEVVTLSPDDNLLKVESLFRSNNFHHLPVVDDERKILGMVSKTDFYKMQDSFTLFNKIQTRKYNDAMFNSILVSEIMARQLAILSPEDSALVAMGMFRENLFHAIPIVDADKKLLGILTTFDLLTYAYNVPLFIENL